MTVTCPPFCQSASRSRRSSREPEKTCPTPVNQPLRSPKHPVVLLCSPSRSRCEQSSKKARPSVRSRKVDTLKAAYSALTKLNLLHYSKPGLQTQSPPDGSETKETGGSRKRGARLFRKARELCGGRGKGSDSCVPRCNRARFDSAISAPG